MQTKKTLIPHHHLLLFLVLMILVTANSASSQTVVISEDLRDTPDRTFGMGRKHYRHMFAGLHFAAGPEEEGAGILYGRSRALEFGMRYKRQFNRVFSAGYEVKLNRMAYFPRQEDNKLVPAPDIYDREKLVFLAAGLAVYQRFNYGKRGDYIGRFVDIGAYGDWNFHTRHVVFFEEEGQNVRTRRSGLDYPAMFGYGLLVRKGFSNFVFSASYRLSDLFEESAMLPEFPRFSLGIELGLHAQ